MLAAVVVEHLTHQRALAVQVVEARAAQEQTALLAQLILVVAAAARAT
jgi:hypothetical protein